MSPTPGGAGTLTDEGFGNL